jgi:nitroimidazol reductase NimA-like FMN-containing flavoprotein (pyridoxamine 5'-phosphate oxidase superfamily)
MAAEKEKTKTAIKKEIIEFLNATSAQVDPKPGKLDCGVLHNNALVLSTCFKNKPRATALEFFNEGFIIYIFGEPGGKIANIKRNSNVSAVVYEQPLNHSRFQRSLQIFGEAELINVRNNPRLYKAKAKKWNLLNVGRKIMSPMFEGKNLSEKEAEIMLEKGLASLNLIKITPTQIFLNEWHPGFISKKYEWKK